MEGIAKAEELDRDGTITSSCAEKVQSVSDDHPKFQPTCKVCDAGVLVPRKIYRMSGPVVAIGYILLVPSILGVAASVAMLEGVSLITTQPAAVPQGQATVVPQDQSPPVPPSLDVDSQYRLACMKGIVANLTHLNMHALLPETLPEQQQICECIISRIDDDENRHPSVEGPVCYEKWLSGAINREADQGTQDVYAQLLNPKPAPPQPAAIAPAPAVAGPPNLGVTILGAIGSGFAIGLGIVSFVSGLLGWLLVMKKRVLQCTVCTATVSAS